MSDERPTLNYASPVKIKLSQDLFVGSIVSWTLLTTVGAAAVGMLIASASSNAERSIVVFVACIGVAGVIRSIYRGTPSFDVRSAVLRGTLIGIGIGLTVVGSIVVMIFSLF